MSLPTAKRPMRRTRRRTGIAVASLALALGLTSCGGADDTPVATAPTTAPVIDDSAAATTDAQTTETAADVTDTVNGLEPRLVDLIGGGQIDINSLEGSDTVLWFWAPW